MWWWFCSPWKGSFWGNFWFFPPFFGFIFMIVMVVLIYMLYKRTHPMREESETEKLKREIDSLKQEIERLKKSKGGNNVTG